MNLGQLAESERVPVNDALGVRDSAVERDELVPRRGDDLVLAVRQVALPLRRLGATSHDAGDNEVVMGGHQGRELLEGGDEKVSDGQDPAPITLRRG